MKKFMALALALVMALSTLTACGGNDAAKTAKVIDIKLTDEQYEELKSVIELIEKANRTKFSEINSDDLVDIKSVNMDQDLSKLENVVKYINEVKNPYYFKVGKVKVRVSYADTDGTLDDAFANLLRIKFM